MTDDLPDLPELGPLKNFESRAWESIFRWLWPVAFSAARHRVGGMSDEDAEDVACETLQELVGFIDRVKATEDLRPLAARIAFCRAVSFVRQRDAAKRGQGRTVSLEERQDASHGIFEPVAAQFERLSERDFQELRDLLDEALGAVEPRIGELIRAHFREGQTYQEMAHRFGMPPGTVAVYMARGLEAIRKAVGRSPKLMKELGAFLR